MILKFWISFSKKLLEVWYWPCTFKHSWMRVLLHALVTIVQLIVGILLIIPQMIEQIVRAKKNNKTLFEIADEDATEVGIELEMYDLKLYAKTFEV